MPGAISVSPLTGTALSTSYTISVSGFYDEDTPLTYKYVYYVSVDDYSTEKVCEIAYYYVAIYT